MANIKESDAPVRRRSDAPGAADSGILNALKERAKELACLYHIEELLEREGQGLDETLVAVAAAIPSGWQHAEICTAEITLGERSYRAPDFRLTEWVLETDVAVQGEEQGRIRVCYLEPPRALDIGPFLKDETKLLEAIAGRLEHYLWQVRMRESLDTRPARSVSTAKEARREWMVAVDLLRKTDRPLLERIARKMMNQLCLRGIPEAKELLHRYGEDKEREKVNGEQNQPQEKSARFDFAELCEATFATAAAYFSDEEILGLIQKWIHQDKAKLLINPLSDAQSSIEEIADALRRFQFLLEDGLQLSESTRTGSRAALIRRFFSEQLEFISVAKRHVQVDDFFNLTERLIYTPGSRGKVGGKSGGLFVASRILRDAAATVPLLGEIKTPKTWYIASDASLAFIHYNNLDEFAEQKYKDIDEIRQEYPHIVQVFKNCHLPPEITKGLSFALDDFGDKPLVVRSSSLLEDRMGSSFSGKYKSLFLANQGTKQARLAALQDAIAEIYASTFGPDPIEYRRERGLLDYSEEMGILIQEVVGRHVGSYYFPAFAGVAFSRNEFRWSPRITRSDGLIRMVPGLGTRAVDRVTDDYPILIAPGQPGLRVNVSVDEVIRYSPKKLDAINLETGRFETLDFARLIKEHGDEYPTLARIVSILQDGRIGEPLLLATDYASEEVVVTFNGLIERTPFIAQIAAILKTLEQELGTPVDIEFAADGQDFYLLQCRPQSSGPDEAAAEIPRGVPPEDVVFTAGRYVSNGRVPDISHIVYVVPEQYSEISSFDTLAAVGRAVGQLNKMLPKHRFILIGPGRWGSRGDIKLGVRVTYADINNTAMLIEVARRKGNYVPDPSFGTHFFQDLVEAGIRYLPLYPDDPEVVFNEAFLLAAENLLHRMLPEYSALAHVVRVIDVPRASGGKLLRVLMNAERDEAMGLLTNASTPLFHPVAENHEAARTTAQQAEEHWRWRLRMAEKIGQSLDAQRFGVEALYVFGSVKNATAGPGSDIDLIVHFRGTPEQRVALNQWLEGWSLCLAEMNYLRTGHPSDGLLDSHIVTDEDISRRSPFASKIGAITDPARLLLTK